MSISSISILVAYILALLLRWFQNHSMVVGWPIFLMDWTRRTIYMAITFVLTYGSIIGIGYFFGIWAGLAALAVKLIVGRVSFHHYFKQAVGEHAEWEYRQMLKDRAIAETTSTNVDVLTENPIDRLRRTLITLEPTDSMDEPAMRAEAFRRAHEAIGNRVRRG